MGSCDRRVAHALRRTSGACHLAETGEAALVEAQGEKQVELSRIEAISGKTWNHPVIAHERLYVRNGEEMACFELPMAAKAKTTE